MQGSVRASAVQVTKDELIVSLEDGRILRVPLEWFPRLRRGTLKQKRDFRLIGRGVGIHWNALDEDLSVAALFASTPLGAGRTDVNGRSAQARDD